MQPTTERRKKFPFDDADKGVNAEIEAHSKETLSIGKLLRSRRENSKLSLKNVSLKTRIGATNLEFLEKDQLHQLPDRAYVIGYVKSYSRILGIDEKQSLALLEKTYRRLGPRPTSVQVTAETAVEIKGIYLQRYMVLAMIVLAVTTIGIFFIFRFGGDYFLRTSMGEKVSHTNAPSAQKDVVVKPQTLSAQSPLRPILQSSEQSETALANAKIQRSSAVSLKEPDQVQESEMKEKPSQDETEEDKLKFFPFVRKLYEYDSKVTPEQTSETIPTRFKNAVLQGKQNVYIATVTGDTWLTYKIDGKPIRQFTLKRGKGLFLQGSEVRVFLGNLDAVKIFLNNRPLAISSRSGVKNLVFPQENRSAYVMPLFIYGEDGVPQTSESYIEKNDIKLSF